MDDTLYFYRSVILFYFSFLLRSTNLLVSFVLAEVKEDYCAETLNC